MTPIRRRSTSRGTSTASGLVHGFFLWGITQYVTPDIITELLHRLGTAADDLGSFAAIG